MSSALTQVQSEIRDLLLADPFFAKVAVLTEQIEDIENEIDRSMAELGIGCIVLTAQADCQHPNMRPVYFEQVTVVIRVFENVTFNRGEGGSGKTASEVAEKIATLIHGWTPDGAPNTYNLSSPSIKLASAPGLLSYDVLAETQFGLEPDIIPQVGVITLTDVAGVISMSCATPGAAIFYTTDGNFPSPRGGTIYTVPFTPGSGVKVTARAWLAGYVASEVISHQT